MTQWQAIFGNGNFAGRDLTGSDFSHRCLVGVDFSNSICKDCDFTGADLSLAKFREADLYRANFTGAILYATTFDGANLTRACFESAYCYGWLLNGSANVAYVDLTRFSIEDARRSVTFSGHSDNIPEIAVGDLIGNTKDSCLSDYQVGAIRFRFTSIDEREKALQRSHVYKRMKRLYQENHQGEMALRCHFFEKHSQTRSWFRESPLVVPGRHQDPLRAVLRTFIGFLDEFVTGYGVRPVRIARMALLLFIVALSLIVYFTLPETGNRGDRATVALADPEVLEGEHLLTSTSPATGGVKRSR